MDCPEMGALSPSASRYQSGGRSILDRDSVRSLKFLERSKTSGAADQSAMQANRHHFWSSLTLLIQDIKRISVPIKLLTRVESLWCRETHIVSIECVRHHKMWTSGLDPTPEREVVGIIVRVVFKVIILGDQPSGVFTGSSGIPASRFLTELSGRGSQSLSQYALVPAIQRFRRS